MLKKELSCKMIEYILSCDDNELAHLDHHSLAENFGVSVRRLDRIFLIHAGLGAEDYIIREKIYRAILMIEQSDTITGEYISRKLGFGEFRLFARQFERLMLVKPDHYIYLKKKNHKLFELGGAGMRKPPAAKLAGR
jgi:transcriptional regulator GlxA family with amidase domain